ncbi:glycosyltransferase [Acidobacteriota bacterium]
MNSQKPKISIVTPCFNAEKYILETAESILNQTAVLSGRVDLEYIIRDGQSKDRTVELIESLNSPHIMLISEPDEGMYDALSKGLQSVTGDITAYLNAGDYYHKCAFDIVLDVFEQKKAKWIHGYGVLYSENSYVVNINMPFRFRRRFFRKGIYGAFLSYLQQESTFWATELLQTVDFDRLKSFKNAGDFYLWHQFATKEEIYIVYAYLGGFKRHQDSLTSRGAKELGSDKPSANNIREIKAMTEKPAVFDYALALFDRVMRKMPIKVKKRLNPQYLILYDFKTNSWY